MNTSSFSYGHAARGHRVGVSTAIIFFSLFFLFLALSASTAKSSDAATASFGVHLFSHEYPSGVLPTDQFARAAAFDHDGNLIVVGTFADMVDFGGGVLASAGALDVYLAKFAPEGDLLWAKRFGDASTDRVSAVSVTSTNNIIMAGDFQGSIDFGAGVMVSAGGYDIYVVAFQSDGTPIGSSRYGDAANQYLNDMVTDLGGNVVFTGGFEGSVNFGGGILFCVGGLDMYVAKLNPLGVHLWSASYGDVTNQVGKAIAVNPAGDVLVAGEFDGFVSFGGPALLSMGADVFLVRYSAGAGAHIWSHSFGDADEDYVEDLAVETTGSMVMVGRFFGNIDFGGGILASAGQEDAYVARFDAAGGYRWSFSTGDADIQGADGVAIAPNGDIVVRGTNNGTVNFGGGAITSSGGHDVFVASLDSTSGHKWSSGHGNGSDLQPGGVAINPLNLGPCVVGTFQNTVDFPASRITSTENHDIFIAQFDAAGGELWSDGYGDWSGRPLVAIAPTADVFMVGEFKGSVDLGGGPLWSAGGTDIFVAKFNPAGAHQWSQVFGDGLNQYVDGVTVDGAGDLIITGRVEGLVNFGGGVLASAGKTDVYVAKFNPAGGHVWSAIFGDAAPQRPAAIATNTVNEIIVVGAFEGTINFGGGVLVSAGSEDVFMAMFDPFGAFLFSNSYGSTDREYASDVAVSPTSGDILVTGDFNSTIDFGKGPLTSAGQTDVFLVAFDAFGAAQWSQSFGDAQRDVAAAVGVDAFDHIALTGYYSGQISFGTGVGHTHTSAGLSDIFLAQFDAAGWTRWSRSIGDALRQRATDLAIDIYNRVVVTAAGNGSIDFGVGPLVSAGSNDIYLARFLSHGTNTCAMHFGDVTNQYVTGVALDATATGNALAAAGFFQGTVDFGGGPFLSVLNPHMFIVKFDAGPLVGVEDGPLPKEIGLRAHPNPFNPATTIEYDVAVASAVTIRVYDAAGSLVDTIVDGVRHMPGVYHTEYQATGASGVYFIKLETAGQTRTVKVVVLK